MALFPIYGRFSGDFLPHLVAVDTDDTMDQVAEKVAVHSVDRRIARPATASGYDVLLDGDVVAPATTLLSPEANGNTWLKAHRDAISLTAGDWNAFRDPDAVTYGSYVAMQDDQETYVEGLLERFDGDGYDESLTDWAAHGHRMAVAGSELLAHESGQPGSEILAGVLAGWRELVEPAGLTVAELAE